MDSMQTFFTFQEGVQFLVWYEIRHIQFPQIRPSSGLQPEGLYTEFFHMEEDVENLWIQDRAHGPFSFGAMKSIDKKPQKNSFS